MALGIGAAAIQHLVVFVPRGTQVFFDWYFTSVNLRNTLLKRGFPATGTIMKNSIPKPCKLTAGKQKEGTGASMMVIRMIPELVLTK